MTNTGYTYIDRIDERSDGLSVLDFYATRYRHSDRGTWQARIEAGEITVDGEDASPDTLLSKGVKLAWSRPPWEEPDAPLEFGVLYLDEDVIAVAKPSGLPVLPGGHHLENTLLTQVRKHYGGQIDPAPVHRLGRATSGIVLFARSPRAAALLFEAFRARTVRKVYRALISGLPATDTFTITDPIGPVPYPPTGSVHAVSPEGRRSRSDCRVLHRDPVANRAIVEVDLITGRAHQIRIHAAAAGHPLVGDPLYISGGLPVASPEASGRWPLPGDTGYCLHAAHVTFPHPGRNDSVSVDCLPPPQLRVPGVIR